MSFSHIRGAQFAKTLSYTIAGNDNVAESKILFSQDIEGRCIYTLSLEIEADHDSLTDCTIRVGQNLSSASPVLSNAFKYDQPSTIYYVTFSGIEEDSFTIDLYATTRNVGSAYKWKGTLDVCVF